VFKTATVVDLLIDRAYRTTPRHVMKITKASSDMTHFDVIYHTSNQRTFPLYTKLFRFPNPFSLRAFGFPVRFAGLFASIIGPRIDALDW